MRGVPSAECRGCGAARWRTSSSTTSSHWACPILTTSRSGTATTSHHPAGATATVDADARTLVIERGQRSRSPPAGSELRRPAELARVERSAKGGRSRPLPIRGKGNRLLDDGPLGDGTLGQSVQLDVWALVVRLGARPLGAGAVDERVSLDVWPLVLRRRAAIARPGPVASRCDPRRPLPGCGRCVLVPPLLLLSRRMDPTMFPH